MTHQGDHGNALLAPVPYRHLVSALELWNTDHEVAFGTDAFHTFRDDGGNNRISGRTPVLIYASRKSKDQMSRDEQANPSVTWEAIFVRYQDVEDFPARDLQ